MKKKLDILRRQQGSGEPYHQVFLFETEDEGATVANALLWLNRQSPLLDVDGREAAPVRWESSCLQKKCGACAMVINGRPGLACDARLSNYKGDTVSLEPLRKFPVVEDLMVDRSILFSRLKELQIWLEENGPSDSARNGLVYEASRCLQCGCCLEVCPNFHPDGRFAGTAAMVPMTRVLAESIGIQEKDLRKNYSRFIYEGCGKSLACHNVCPAGIDIEQLMVRSNAAAVWRRPMFRKKGKA